MMNMMMTSHYTLDYLPMY